MEGFAIYSTAPATFCPIPILIDAELPHWHRAKYPRQMAKRPVQALREDTEK